MKLAEVSRILPAKLYWLCFLLMMVFIAVLKVGGSSLYDNASEAR